MSSETQEGFDTPPCSPSGKRAKVAADDLHATFQAIFEDDDTPDYGSVPLSQTDNWQPISKPISKRLSLAADGGNLAQAKTIHDRIHGQIFMESVLVAIIDTPEFQRLRDLKQLGGTVYVYPSACHARFEHCLGVSHLAGLTVDHLIKTDNQNLNISERDRICVKIAGLCHDLGHGPFSHTFEHFVNSVRRKEGKAVWEHEAMSLNLLDHLLEKNNIDLSEYGLELPADLNFIKLLISGLGVEHSWPNNTARSERYRFLTDIVANKRNGLDVDKFDYFVRDSICAIGAQPIVCDVERIIKSCRALEVDSQMQICYEQKMALQLMDLFKLRAWLHKFVYQHHTVNVIEEMICDVLTAANDHLRCITDRNGLQRRLSDAVEDEEAFCHLGDWILNLIEASHDPSLRKAQTILHRLRSRKLYYALHVPLKVENHLRAEVVAEEILSYLPSQRARELREELLIHFTYIDFGRRDKTGKATDPIDDVRFFNPKEGVMVARSIASRPKCDLLMPRAFSERLMYVYSRSDDAWDDLRQAFQQWRQHLGTSQRNVSSKLTAPISTGNQASPQKAAIRIQRSMSRDMRQHGIKLRHYKSI